MAVDSYTILHRKDERGVIVDSKVFGPDDEIPEGFEAAEYQPVYTPREDDQEPVAESKLTPWDSPVAKGGWVEQPEPEEVEEILSEAAEDEGDEQVEDDESDELPVPPQGGAGSGRDVWAAYAASKDVAVDTDDTRDEIIAACEAAGVPVD